MFLPRAVPAAAAAGSLLVTLASYTLRRTAAFSARLPIRGCGGPSKCTGGTSNLLESTSSPSLSDDVDIFVDLNSLLRSSERFVRDTAKTTAARRCSSTTTRLYSSQTSGGGGGGGGDTAKETSSSSSSSKNEPRHDVRQGGNNDDDESPMEIDEEEIKLQQRLAEHQQNAPKLGWATDIRTLVQYNHGFAVMSTNSKSDPGYPGGSVVGFAPDEQGRPIFVFSGMSTHTQDILADPRCSVTIAAKEFKGAADGRVNLMGEVKLMPREDIEAAKALYLKKHPGAFWINFGDFNWFRMDNIQKIRFVGGFARAGAVTPTEYTKAKPDPIAEFGSHIAQHMNDDHMDATIAMIGHYIPGLDVTEAVITSVDSLGMYIKCTRTPRASDQPQQFKIRLPFPRQAADRKDVKTLIVEMTQAASSSA